METVKIDFRNDLYNYMIEELKQYAEIMKDTDSGKEAEKLISKTEKYVQLGTDKDGTEFAVMRYLPSDAGELIGILVMLATVTTDAPYNHYEHLKKQRTA